MHYLYQGLDGAFFMLHSALMVFLMTGWAWRRMRRWHMLSVALVWFSWFGLGAWYGWGFCPCTEWHWRVRMALGKTDMPASYVKFLVDSLTGWDVPALWVDGVVLVSFLGATLLCIVLSWRDWRRRKAVAVRPED